MNNINILLELVFPTRCAGCGEHAGRLLCPRCNASLHLIRGPACTGCGRPAPRVLEVCQECRGRLRHVDTTVALAVYQEPLRSAIHKLKYDNGWRLAPLLGAMAAARLAPMLRSPHPVVTFVPMHRRKRRMRGYDHAEKLAQGVGGALGLEVIHLLERSRPTTAQSSLSHEDRRRNVRGAFRATDGRLHGEEIVLVDDILTTGYTLSECAAALKAHGAGRVTACVLARDLLEGRVFRRKGGPP